MKHINNEVFYKYIKDRIKKNKNFIGVAVGSPGSGKSYGMLRIAEKLDNNFSIDRVAFSSRDFLLLLKEPSIKSGSVIIFDEAGAIGGVNARKWWDTTNLAINFVLQTFRYRNIILLITLPDYNFLDSAIRKLATCVFETAGMDQRRGFSTMKAKIQQTNPITGFSYGKFVRFSHPVTGHIHLVNRLYLKKPSTKMRNAYEKRKKVFGDNLIDAAIAMTGLKDKKKEDGVADDKLYNLYKTFMEKNPNANMTQICLGLRLNRKAVLRLHARAR